MPTTKKTTTEETTETTKEKKPRKQREKREKCILLRPHPKYAELMQAFDKGNWVLIDPSSEWKKSAPLTDVAIGKLAKSLVADPDTIKVLSEVDTGSFDAVAWLSGACHSAEQVTHSIREFNRKQLTPSLSDDFASEMNNVDKEDEATLSAE